MASLVLLGGATRAWIVALHTLEGNDRHRPARRARPPRIRRFDLIRHPLQLRSTRSATKPLLPTFEVPLAMVERLCAFVELRLAQIQQPPSLLDLLPALGKSLHLEIDQRSDATAHRDAGYLAVPPPHIPKRRRDRNLDLLPPILPVDGGEEAPIGIG